MLEGGGDCPSPVTFETSNLSCTNAILYMHTHPLAGSALSGWLGAWLNTGHRTVYTCICTCMCTCTCFCIYILQILRIPLVFEREFAVTTMGLIGSAGGLSDN